MAKEHEAETKEEKREHEPRRRGGRAAAGGDDANRKVNMYNAQGSPEEAEAKDETPDFKRGGRKRRRAGGEAMGAHEEGRHDRRPRRAAGGRTGTHSPYSSAGPGKDVAQGGDHMGHEGTRPPTMRRGGRAREAHMEGD